MSINNQKASEWYRAVRQRLNAGLPLVEAIRESGNIGKRNMNWFWRNLQEGISLDEVLRAAPAWFPERDRLLISAGAESGKLVECFRALQEDHKEIGDAKRKAKASLTYPIFLIHALLLLNPISGIDLVGAPLEEIIKIYAIKSSIGIGAFWLIIFIFFKLWHISALFRGFLEYVLLGFRSFNTNLGYYHFARNMGNFLQAGADYNDALAGAAVVSEREYIKDRALASLEEIKMGVRPSEAFRESKLFPELYLNYYTTGEDTGTQPEALNTIALHARDRALTTIRRMRFWYPKLILAIVFAIVLYKTTVTFADYLEQIERLLAE